MTGWNQSDVVFTPPAAGVISGAIAFYPYGVAAGTVYSAAATIFDSVAFNAPAQSGEAGTLKLAGKSTGTVVHP